MPSSVDNLLATGPASSAGVAPGASDHKKSKVEERGRGREKKEKREGRRVKGHEKKGTGKENDVKGEGQGR